MRVLVCGSLRKIKEFFLIAKIKDFMQKTQKEKIWDVVVIGGGPAGMMSAGRAGERGLQTLLLEKNSTLGKKLLITGGGRCNVTNNKQNVRTMLKEYKGNDKFLFSAFTQFGVKETLEFFNNKGMDTKEELEGRMFPATNKAKSVWDVVVEYMKNGGVEIQTSAGVEGITYSDTKKIFTINLAGSKKVFAKKCVVATGGVSRPETGSTGEGFKWLQKLGHKIAQNDLALVPIVLGDNWVKKLAGVTLDGVKLTTYKNNKKQKVYKGKLLFTHVGISGPTVLNMSREVGDLLSGEEGSEYLKKEKEEDVKIVLDLFPSLDSRQLKEKLQNLLVKESNKKIKNVFSSLVAPNMVGVLLNLASIDGETFSHSVRSEERKVLLALLKAIPLGVKGLLGKDKAVVSSGGVLLEQVNFKTMQSKVLPQLYLVGDVLNVDRPSGGYSLQLCWTTGFVAGDSC